MIAKLVIATAAGTAGAYVLFAWRGFQPSWSGICGAMIAFLVYHSLQAIDRLKAIYRKEEW